MPKVKLEDVAIEVRESFKGNKSGVPIVGLEHIIPEEVRLSSWDVDSENTFTKMFRTGDILFGRRRAYLKKAAQAPCDGICSGDITVIRAKKGLILPELLPFVIQDDAFFAYAVERSAGSLSPRVKWENLKEYTFYIPEMDEQAKLAELLWSINDTLCGYQKLQKATRELVEAQFVDSFYGHDYPFVKMRDLISQETQTERVVDPLHEKYVTVALYGNGVRERNIEKYDPKPFSGYRVKAGQFIYSRIDARNGAFGIVPQELNGAVVSKDFPVFDITGEIIPSVLLYSMQDNNFIQQIKKNSLGTTNRQRIKEEVFLEYSIVLPPMEKQEEFDKLLRSSETAIQNLQTSIESLKVIKTKIFSDYSSSGRKE